MRRRLARGFAVGIASGALVMAPMAAVASAVESPDIIIETDRIGDPSIIIETDWLDNPDIIIETDWDDDVDGGDIAPL
jgi:hypothetical protein